MQAHWHGNHVIFQIITVSADPKKTFQKITFHSFYAGSKTPRGGSFCWKVSGKHWWRIFIVKQRVENDVQTVSVCSKLRPQRLMRKLLMFWCFLFPPQRLWRHHRWLQPRSDTVRDEISCTHISAHKSIPSHSPFGLCI